MQLSVREIEERDIPYIASYWVDSDGDFMEGMGVDLSKLPTVEGVTEMLQSQLNNPYQEKQSFATIWEVDGEAIGHCNVNKIVFGQEAYMHLHIWDKLKRRKGIGMQLVKKSLQMFFDKLELQTVYCEPYALNESPNKTLEKVGFTFEKEYVTTPGYLNFEQPVKRWRMDKDKF